MSHQDVTITVQRDQDVEGFKIPGSVLIALQAPEQGAREYADYLKGHFADLLRDAWKAYNGPIAESQISKIQDTH